jgi:hypothetical protein
LQRSFRDDVALNLTNGSREGDHPNASRTDTSAGRSARVCGRPGRVHVVDDAHVGLQRLVRDDASTDVAPPLVEREAALTRERLRSFERIVHRDAPQRRQLVRERTRRDVAALTGSLGIARHGNEALGRRVRDRLHDEPRRFTCQATASALLPAANEGLRPRVIDDRRPRLDEREPAAGALGASSDRPRTR